MSRIADGAPVGAGGDERSDVVERWALAGASGPLLCASYLTAPYAAQYRLIVDVLLKQQQHSLTGVSFDDLEVLVREEVLIRHAGAAAGLLGDGFELVARLKSLTDWQVVTAWQDRAVRDEDFLTNLTRYQLTAQAADLHRAVGSLGADLATQIAATLAPQVISAQLTILVSRLTNGSVSDTDTDQVVAEAWATLTPTLAGMGAAAASWQARLAGALAGAPTPEKVEVLQETLRRYVDMWGTGVDTEGARIAELAAVLDTLPDQVWRGTALAVLGADAEETRVNEYIGGCRTTLRTLRAWFHGPDSQSRRLRRQIRDTIAPMIRGQRTLAAVGRHVSRRAELLNLAGRLERAGDDVGAWEVWCGATGLFSARHLPVSSPMPGGTPSAVSWWDAEPAPVEARLRELGPRSNTGNPARIPDRSAGKAAARVRAVAERVAAAATRLAILRRSGLPLSRWGVIDAAETEVLISMLSALAGVAADADGFRRAGTGDGLWSVTACPVVGGPPAVVRTEHGRIVHADLVLTMVATGMPEPESAPISAPGLTHRDEPTQHEVTGAQRSAVHAGGSGDPV